MFHTFIGTPCFPSYPSNHASGSRAAAEVLKRAYGEGNHMITIANPLVPSISGITLHYKTFNDICNDVDDARVYGGIHFRFDQAGGNRVGRAVALRTAWASRRAKYTIEPAAAGATGLGGAPQRLRRR